MDEKKRIIEFDAAESVPVDGQLPIDSASQGTKKITPALLLKAITDLLGNETLDTTAQTCTGAINELKGTLTTLDNIIDGGLYIRGTLGGDVLNVLKNYVADGVTFYISSNQPTNRPTGIDYGCYLFFRREDKASILCWSKAGFACSQNITISTDTSITWHVV